MQKATSHERRSGLFAAAVLAPLLLAACTTTPQTTFDWNANTRIAVHHRVHHHPAPVYAARRPRPSHPVAVARNAPRSTPAWYQQSQPQEVQPAEAYGPAHFVWPVRGEVLVPYGQTANGERNDGINIAANMDAPIRASDSGTVVYAENGPKGYGKLILIRHGNGYITAYAHADRLVVARGDRVAQGQIIGYAGDSGGVATPQLHFEIRRGSKPVDPSLLLAASG